MLQRGLLEAQYAAEMNFLTEIGINETMRTVIEFRVIAILVHGQGIEFGDLVTARAVSADQLQRVDRIFGLLEKRRALAARRRRALVGFAVGFGFGVGIGDADNGCGRGRPTRTFQILQQFGFVVGQVAEERCPACVDRFWVFQIAGVDFRDKSGVSAGQERGVHGQWSLRFQNGRPTAGTGQGVYYYRIFR